MEGHAHVFSQLSSIQSRIYYLPIDPEPLNNNVIARREVFVDSVRRAKPTVFFILDNTVSQVTMILNCLLSSICHYDCGFCSLQNDSNEVRLASSYHWRFFVIVNLVSCSYRMLCNCQFLLHNVYWYSCRNLKLSCLCYTYFVAIASDFVYSEKYLILDMFMKLDTVLWSILR